MVVETVESVSPGRFVEGTVAGWVVADWGAEEGVFLPVFDLYAAASPWEFISLRVVYGRGGCEGMNGLGKWRRGEKAYWALVCPISLGLRVCGLRLGWTCWACKYLVRA